MLPIVTNGKITLRVIGEKDAVYSLDYPDVEGYILGRSDSQNPTVPDVDFVRFNARERGVSRRHAALLTFNGQLHILDLDSSNGTFVNERRAVADVPLALKDGDKILLGELEIVISVG